MLPAAITFLSAFLLFMVQLLTGKLLLPWFGGSPAVWTTCMLFFQILLLGGYAYAHGLTRLPIRLQGKLHALLLIASVALLGVAWWHWGSPLIPSDDWKPNDIAAPQFRIITLLLVSIGLPFFLLSTTSPLIQHWQGLAGSGGKTWRLYAVSNTGSLLGLLCYPFLIERFFTLPVQAIAWTSAFALFALGAAVSGLRPRSASIPVAESSAIAADPKTSRFTRLIWIVLPMCTSAMLLSVTNELCQEIASIPFLWMLPLSLYLLSFIICFDRPAWYHRRFFIAAAAVASIVSLVTSSLGIDLKIPFHVASLSTFLFLFCMVGHGELVRLRPATSRLTLFYLMVAIGGAIGGIFVSVVAPQIFKNFWEFNVMTTAAWALLGILLLREKDSMFHRGDWWQFLLFVWLILYLAIRFGSEMILSHDHLFTRNLLFHALIAGAAAWILCFPIRKTRWACAKYWPRITVVGVIFFAECFMLLQIRTDQANALHSERNFYGTLRIAAIPPPHKSLPPVLQLNHGHINHGYQYLDKKLSQLPVSYYGDTSGVDVAISRHPRRLANPPLSLNIGILGLGTGTMAAHGKSGDRVRFYEINPAVIRFSKSDHPYFTYLRDSPATTQIIEGDARLSLERELAGGNPGKFDVLVMDAFSSDSIPVHLLTREAFALYEKHLRDADSIIAVHISNRFLDLRDLISSQAKIIDFFPLSFDLRTASPTHSPSSWVLLTRSSAFFKDPVVHQYGFPCLPRNEVVWTDSHSNLYQLLRW